MNVGFTGTRVGMSNKQKLQLIHILNMFRKPIHKFIHGHCVGADREAEVIYVSPRSTHLRRVYAGVVRYPAHAYGSPLERNRAIVARVDVLIAAPQTDKEVLRSGTWATVRYARAKGIPIIMLSR